MTAKANILARLRSSLAGTQPVADDYDVELVTQPWSYPPHERVARLRQLMEAVHTETHLTSSAGWPALLEQLLLARRLPSLLIAPATAHGAQFAAHLAGRDSGLQLKAYDRPVEDWKAELFHDTPASLTGTLGAIAATGSLILWPDRHEPRLMSLVPPVHFALLQASQIHNNFHEVLQAQGWAAGMPTNALLVSGPSKTADIEQVLAYGAHGPSDLIVLILEDA